MRSSLDQFVANGVATTPARRKEAIPGQHYGDARLIHMTDFVDAGVLDHFSRGKRTIRLVMFRYRCFFDHTYHF